MKTIESIKKPETYTVQALEELLKQAKEGEIVGVCYGCVHADGKCSYGMAGNIGNQPNRLAGALANGLLAYQMTYAVETVPDE